MFPRSRCLIFNAVHTLGEIQHLSAKTTEIQNTSQVYVPTDEH